MSHVALLRGINVGGKNKVEMARLRTLLEEVGLSDVTTYISTGNVLFRGDETRQQLRILIEEAIEDEFRFHVDVLVRDADAVVAIADALPDHWVNDGDMKCDVLYLWDEIDGESVLDELTIRPDIEDVVYVPGAVLWRVDRENVTRSGLMRLAGIDLYKLLTVRNANTARKLAELARAYGA